MRKTRIYFMGLAVLAIMGLVAVSCSKEDETPKPTVQISYSVDGYQVAFQALATNAESFAWDFGDGETSTEQNPVHKYAQSGKYDVKVTATGKGGTAEATTTVEIAASKYEMLTGGPAMKETGKSWQFSQQAGQGDAVLKANQDFTSEQPIPSGMLGLIGMESEYQDEFIFFDGGQYGHVTADDSVITTTVYAYLTQQSDKFRQSSEDAVGKLPFTPSKNATFKLEEGVDLTLAVTSDENKDSTWNVTWSDVDVFEIKDEQENEFFGVLDFTRKYIVFDIATDHMQVGMFISATDGSKANYPSHVIRMTFVPKSE